MRQVRVEARQALIVQARRADAATERAWRPILAQLSRDLATASPEQANALVLTATRRMAEASFTQAAAGITAAVAGGARAGSAQQRALTRSGGPMAGPDAASIQVGLDEQRQRTLREAAVNGSFARDRVPLSSRLYRNADEAGRSAAEVVRTAISARDGVFQASERFIAANEGGFQVPIPRYVYELTQAAHAAIASGDSSLLERAIARHVDQMEALGQGRSNSDGMHSIRSSVRQFVQDLRRASATDIERIVDRHVRDRMQIQARRVMRTEMAEAHRRAYRATTDESPATVGYRWVLSPSHPRADVCDLLAQQNLHGLGPGGYPKDEVPETPHPNCLCSLAAIVDEHYLRRKLASLKGAEPPPTPWVDQNLQTAEEWLRTQPEAFQNELLGPTRAAILRDPNDDRPVIGDRGIPIPVRVVLSDARRP